MSRFWLLSILLIIATPAIALAAPRTWSALVDTLVSLMNKGVATLITFGFAVYFYGLWSNILKFGEESDAEKRRHISLGHNYTFRNGVADWHSPDYAEHSV